jgi:hypothetical protein
MNHVSKKAQLAGNAETVSEATVGDVVGGWHEILTRIFHSGCVTHVWKISHLPGFTTRHLECQSRRNIVVGKKTPVQAASYTSLGWPKARAGRLSRLAREKAGRQ